MSTAPHAVRLHELLAAEQLVGLEVLYRSERAATVRDVIIVGDIEAVSDVGPDTIVVLTDAVALGGWMVSAALRYAWERRAVALVVPAQSHTSTVVDLASRLDVTMIATSRDVTRVALDLSRNIGILQAAMRSRIALLHERLLAMTSVDSVVTRLSESLGGAPVSLRVAGAVIARSSASSSTATPSRRVDRKTPEECMVEVLGHHDEVPAQLVTLVAPGDVEDARAILRAAGPVVRALLLREELRSGLGAAGVLPSAARVDAGAVTALPERLVAVVFLVGDDADAGLLGSPLAQVWRRVHPTVPLERTEDGWLAVLAAPSTDFPHLVRARDVPTLGALGVHVGVSRVHRQDAMPLAFTEARFAAQLAAAGDILRYDAISPALVERALPAAVARQLASDVVSEVLADPHAAELLAAVAAYFDCAGSVARAAQRLGVHRNTVQARIRRAGELGLNVHDADRALLTHLIASAWSAPEPKEQ